MTIPQWVITVLVAVVGGLFGGIVAPLINAAQARKNWRTQKRFEVKYDIFRGATGALASWMTDALDPQLQGDKQSYKGLTRAVEMRPATAQALEHYQGLLRAFFSKDVAAKYETAQKARVSIENVPNTEFEYACHAFQTAASKELGLMD